MPLHWDLSAIPSYRSRCYQEAPVNMSPSALERGGYVPDPAGVPVRLHPVTRALIYATPHIGLPALTETNLPEALYRLDALYDAGLSFLSAPTTEGPVPLPLSLTDLQLHVGLRTSAPSWTKSRFDREIRQLREARLAPLFTPDTDTEENPPTTPHPGEPP